jgi:hypothetical protein
LIGTGKTRTITALIDILIASNLHVHATAPTNIAVTELAKRFVSNYSNRKTLIIGTLSRLKLSDDLLPHHLDIKESKIKTSIGTYSLAKQQLKDLLRSDQNDDLHQKFQDTFKKIQECFLIFLHDSPLGLIKHKLSDEDLSRLEYLISAPKEEFLEWLHDRENEVPLSDSEKTFCQHFNQLTACLKRITINYSLIPNLKLTLLKQAEVIFSTVNVGGREIFSLIPIDVSIVDEATQLLQGDIATMFRSDLQCLVLVGDEKQLPAVVTSPQCQSLGFGFSLFDRLIHLRYPFTMLDIQYRMHPMISSWPSGQFYDGKILNGENVLSEAYNKPWHRDLSPLELYDVREGCEGKDGPSLFHEIQAAVVRRIATSVTKLAQTESSLSIGIISPYKKQISLLSHLAKDSPTLKIKVCTIDGFQGQESDVIILTTVRSNPDRKIGFLSDLRRLNVGITRSKYSIILVGDVHTISSNPAWRDYVDYLKCAGKIHHYGTSPIIKKVVNSHRESIDRFHQLGDLQKDILNNAKWVVSFSSEFQKSLQSDFVQAIKNDIMRKILDLAHGVWLKWEAKTNFASPQYSELIHVQRIQKFSLVWTVDIERNKRVQCIKIWDFVESSSIPKIVRRIENSYHKYSDFYLECCKQKPLKNSTTKKFEPRTWINQNEEIAWYKQTTAPMKHSVVDQTGREDDSVISKFYHLSSEVANLLISETTVLDLPFVMSPEENLIVSTHRSMFILGRSGTGEFFLTFNFLTLFLRENDSPTSSNVFRKGKSPKS